MPAKNASFRLIVSCNIGAKEIERLIKSANWTKGFLPIRTTGTRPF
jgi:hypothetical protein